MPFPIVKPGIHMICNGPRSVCDTVVMVVKVKLDSTFLTITTVSQTDRRPLQIIWKPGFNYPAVPHTWVLVYHVNQRSHVTKITEVKRNLTQFIGGKFNHNFISIVIGSYTSGINVVGSSSDLFDVSMEIYLGKCRSHPLNAVSRGKRVIYRGKSVHCNRTYYFTVLGLQSGALYS